MSLCLAVQARNFMIVTSDSIVTFADEDGRECIYPENCQTLFEIDNKILFVSGVVEVLQNILREYDQSKDKSIQHLKNIVIDKDGEYKKANLEPLADNEVIADIVLFIFENGKSVIYNICTTNNYEIVRTEYKDSMNYIAVGSHSSQALELLNSGFNDAKNYTQIEESKVQFNTERFFENIFDELACLQIGGLMSLYIMTPNEVVKRHIYKIKEVK